MFRASCREETGLCSAAVTKWGSVSARVRCSLSKPYPPNEAAASWAAELIVCSPVSYLGLSIWQGKRNNTVMSLQIRVHLWNQIKRQMWLVQWWFLSRFGEDAVPSRSQYKRCLGTERGRLSECQVGKGFPRAPVLIVVRWQYGIYFKTWSNRS